jgi:hypothetical protein
VLGRCIWARRSCLLCQANLQVLLLVCAVQTFSIQAHAHSPCPLLKRSNLIRTPRPSLMAIASLSTRLRRFLLAHPAGATLTLRHCALLSLTPPTRPPARKCGLKSPGLGCQDRTVSVFPLWGHWCIASKQHSGTGLKEGEQGGRNTNHTRLSAFPPRRACTARRCPSRQRARKPPLGHV